MSYYTIWQHKRVILIGTVEPFRSIVVDDAPWRSRFSVCEDVIPVAQRILLVILPPLDESGRGGDCRMVYGSLTITVARQVCLSGVHFIRPTLLIQCNASQRNLYDV